MQESPLDLVASLDRNSSLMPSSENKASSSVPSQCMSALFIPRPPRASSSVPNSPPPLPRGSPSTLPHPTPTRTPHPGPFRAGGGVPSSPLNVTRSLGQFRWISNSPPYAGFLVSSAVSYSIPSFLPQDDHQTAIFPPAFHPPPPCYPPRLQLPSGVLNPSTPPVGRSKTSSFPLTWKS